MIQGNVVITCYQTLIANHKRSQACGIDLGDSYVVTGGEFSRRTVALYSLTGTLTYLADLQVDRYRHACSSFLDSNGDTVSLSLSTTKLMIIISVPELFGYRWIWVRLSFFHGDLRAVDLVICRFSALSSRQFVSSKCRKYCVCFWYV